LSLDTLPNFIDRASQQYIMGRKSLRFRALERILLLYRNASWLFALEHLDQLIKGNAMEMFVDVRIIFVSAC